MLEYLVAVNESAFRFDVPGLVEAARRTWPEARVVVPTGDLAALVEVFVEVPTRSPQAAQLQFQTGSDGIRLDTPTREDAAAVLAWLTTSAPIPGDGSVLLVDWANDLVPLRPGMTAEDLLRIPEPGAS